MITKRLIEALDVGAAAAEMHGQKLNRVLARAWIAATDGDESELEDAIVQAKQEDFALRGIMLNVREALNAFDGGTP